jgi:hypothetical protein
MLHNISRFSKLSTRFFLVVPTPWCILENNSTPTFQNIVRVRFFISQTFASFDHVLQET